MGTLPDDPKDRPPEKPPTFRERQFQIPDSFDAREKWPYCPSIGEIEDQGSCGSCWAVATTSAMSDRLCINSHGSINVRISANDMISCCDFCGKGCQGGRVYSAWSYWSSIGVVTGGNYVLKQGCRPYEIPPCEHHIKGPRPPCLNGTVPTPSCKNVCQDGYNVPYYKDKYFGGNPYTVRKVEDIQREILVNGPVTVGFRVYTDFFHYKSGVYIHVDGDIRGNHAVKLLGWGVENNIPYWLVANSWNSDWGDKGYFKILRGFNHCDIESRVIAGMPRLK